MTVCFGSSGQKHIIALSESEGAEVNVKRFKNQDILVEESYAFLCANVTLKCPKSPRPSPIAEGDFEQEGDDEIEEDDKKECFNKDSRSIRGDTIYRDHEEPRLKLCDQLEEIFPDHVEIRRRDEANKLLQTQNCEQNESKR